MNQEDRIISLYNNIDYEVKLLALNDEFSRLKIDDNSSVLIISMAKTSTIILDQQEIELKEKHSCFYYSQGLDLFLIAKNEKAKICILTFKAGFLKHSEIELGNQEKIEKLFQSSSTLRCFRVPSIHSNALGLIHTQLPESLLSTFYKGTSLNIFCKLIAYLELSTKTESTRLRDIDMEKIKTAKGLIESNLSQNFTISQLARIVGTNEQYLKKHFKQFYGMTVFNFIVDCKMNKAKLMLKEKDVKVSSISQQLGYRHATHFTTAFKKFFGYTPNALRYLFAVFIDNYLAIKDIAMIYI